MVNGVVSPNSRARMVNMIRDFQMLMKKAISIGPKKVAVILPHERASIEAINYAQIEGLAEGILIGQSSLI